MGHLSYCSCQPVTSDDFIRISLSLSHACFSPSLSHVLAAHWPKTGHLLLLVQCFCLFYSLCPRHLSLSLNLMPPLSCLSNSVTLWNYAFVTILAAMVAFTPAPLLEGALHRKHYESSGPVDPPGPCWESLTDILMMLALIRETPGSKV